MVWGKHRWVVRRGSAAQRVAAPRASPRMGLNPKGPPKCAASTATRQGGIHGANAHLSKTVDLRMGAKIVSKYACIATTPSREKHQLYHISYHTRVQRHSMLQALTVRDICGPE